PPPRPGPAPRPALSNDDLTYAILNPASGAAGFHVSAASATELSRLSGPYAALSTSTASSTYRHIGPHLSMVVDSAIAPYRLMRPHVGRRPNTPVAAEAEGVQPRGSLPT